ncbi:MAG: RHS repeat-associated core domain-containing protein [Acidobacteriia bacterium]|nr:RHS repeat-associated core domain-containing protein [Terriglobia bacterium]
MTGSQLAQPETWEAGNTTQDGTGVGTHTYQWDAEGRLKSVDDGTTASYVYNALGQRVEKLVSSAYTEIVYGLGGQPIGYHNRTDWTDQFFYLGATPFAKYQGNVTYFIHGNHLGSTSMVFNHTGGTVAQDEIFYPWGERWDYAGTLYDERFASLGRRDAETGNDPTLFRMYESRLYRWLSPDPGAGSIYNPQSLNRYAYVLNNPVSFIDPLGLDPTCTITIVDDQHLLSSTQLAEAQIEIINMFKQAGINVMFNQTNPDFTVTLVPQPGFWQAGVQPGDLAVNDAYLGGLLGVASSATAFTERIGKEVGPNMGTALGRVVAHEFGHFGLGLVHRKGWPGELEIGIMAQGLDWLSNGQNFDPRLHVPQLQAFCE